MAPVDRTEHRQQRMRGAGVANVQTNFSFNLGGLALSRPAKQASFPPQHSSRKTPVRGTTPRANGSAQRHRSASVQRSSARSRSISRSSTPRQNVVTPQLGKRKRGSKPAASGQTDEEEDELSPNRDDENAPSVEKSRKVAATISRIREEVDLPDELSFIGEPMSSVRKAGGSLELIPETPAHVTPVPVAAKARSLGSIHSSLATPRIIEGPENDELATPSQSDTLPVRSKTKTPLRSIEDDGEEDELSPPKNDTTAPEPVVKPTRIEPHSVLSGAEPVGDPFTANAQIRRSPRQAVDDEEAIQSTLKSAAPSPAKPVRCRRLIVENEDEDVIVQVAQKAPSPAVPPVTLTENKPSRRSSAKRKRLQESLSPPPKRREPQHYAETEEEEDIVHTTPAAHKPRRVKSKSVELSAPSQEEEEEIVDELSPEGERTRQPLPKAASVQEPAETVLSEEEEEVVDELPEGERTRRSPPKAASAQNPTGAVLSEKEEEVVDEQSPEGERTQRSLPKAGPAQKSTLFVLSDEDDVSDIYEESQQEDEESDLEPQHHSTPRPPPQSPRKKKSKAPQPQPISKPKPDTEKPPKKRQKRGPTQIISVMRLKGHDLSHAVKGLTVVDTTRTVMEEWTAHKINRITEKLTNVRDSARAKIMKQHRNVILAYRERLDDVLLDLQDANNTSGANSHKLKNINRDNKRLRSEYLTLQNEREQILYQNDEVTEAFVTEKKTVEMRNELSTNLYDIEAAIQSGRERARKLGRADEGPDVPLKMLIDGVARDVAGAGRGGLLGRVQGFNGVLDRAAGLLEGRV